MITKTSIPNDLLLKKEQSQKSYDYPKYSLKRVMNIKAIISKIKKNLSEAICIIMGGSQGQSLSMG